MTSDEIEADRHEAVWRRFLADVASTPEAIAEEALWAAERARSATPAEEAANQRAEALDAEQMRRAKAKWANELERDEQKAERRREALDSWWRAWRQEQGLMHDAAEAVAAEARWAANVMAWRGRPL